MMKVKYIAEVALCHKGSKDLAKKFVKNFKKTKAQFLKFHLLIADEIADKDYKYFKLFKSFEMPDKQWMEVSRFAKSNGVKLIFDILGAKSLKVACKCGIKIIKLHSTDIYNYPLHDEIKKSSVHTVIISAGGCHKEEIVKVVKKLSNKKIIIIFGYQIYPTKSCNLNLSKILLIKNSVNLFKNVSFAYADHSPNGILETIYNCSSAISYGAEIIEKHFAFNKSIKTDSDKSAFNISQFNIMIKLINQCFFKKKKHKWFHNDELIYRKNVSRNFFAKKNIKQKQKVTLSNLELKRGKSAPKIHIDKIIGKKAKKDILAGEELTEKNIKI